MSARNDQPHVGEPGYESTSEQVIAIRALNSDSEWIEDFKRVLTNPEIKMSSKEYQKARAVYEDMEANYGTRDGESARVKADALENRVGLWGGIHDSTDKWKDEERY